MLIVVLYHSMLFWNNNWFVGKPVYSSKLLEIIATWMNSFHIYGFTMISGYLFYYLKYEGCRYNKFTQFAKNKARRLLIPYFFVSIIWVIPLTQIFYNYSFVDVIQKYLLGISPSQLWFLLMLFGVFILFYPLSDFARERFGFSILLAAVFYCAGILGDKVLPNCFQIFTACKFIPFFLLGFKIRQIGSTKIKKIPCLVWIIGDILIFCFRQILFKFDGAIFSIIRITCELLLHVVGTLMAFVVLQKIADSVKWKENVVLRLLSKYSMSIYLLHQQIIYVLIYYLNGYLNPHIHTLVNFVGSTAISIILSFIFMNFKWTRKLIGEK